jgi:hypothetical protein
VSDRANLQSEDAVYQAFGVSKLLDSAMAIKYKDTSTELGLTEQLYTARGSQSLGMQANVAKELGINLENYDDLFLNTLNRASFGKPNIFY